MRCRGPHQRTLELGFEQVGRECERTGIQDGEVLRRNERKDERDRTRGRRRSEAAEETARQDDADQSLAFEFRRTTNRSTLISFDIFFHPLPFSPSVSHRRNVTFSFVPKFSFHGQVIRVPVLSTRRTDRVDVRYLFQTHNVIVDGMNTDREGHALGLYDENSHHAFVR